MTEGQINAVCVFCGSRPGTDPAYEAAALGFGRGLANANVTLVFGAGGIGLMGAVAEGALAAGGHVAGVIPKSLLERESGNGDLPEIHVVDTMHERKAKMHDLSDAFVVLPGGLGTYEEFFEILTWRQLGFHDKPIIVVDVAGYFDPLRQIVRHGVDQGFLNAKDEQLFSVVDSIEEAFALLGIAAEIG